jgi:hypothetical protein
MITGTAGPARIARDGARELEAVLPRHDHVHQDQVGLVLGQRRIASSPLARRCAPGSRAPEQLGQVVQLGLRVVDEQDFVRHGSFPGNGLPHFQLRTGAPARAALKPSGR